NSEVVIFIAAEWYEGEGGPGEHISHIAHKDAQGFYEVTIDDRFQYGQKNKNGDARFVVYHDKGRKQYQHRFIESGLTSVGTEVAVKIAGVFGYGAEANIAKVVGEGVTQRWESAVVPLDYAVPDGPKAGISLITIPSKFSPGDETTEAQSSLIPKMRSTGGPGGSGIALALSLGAKFQKLASDEYDIVGHDPRRVSPVLLVLTPV
ncbi:uncharacterized protein PHACADRAFT_199799, partial [Phanerochaete carnosa HHB-10118-sp]